jgi:2-polyprenyl-6-methoxyphenol hydroxylase-like FAD-dependent oxidoreductase
MDMQTVRCCISGGGPAGMMLGYLLARAGIEVAVLEKWPDFFRDFRGDTIHPSSLEVLYEIDLLDEFLKLPHDKTTRVEAQIGGVPVTIADFSWLSIRTPYIAFTPQWHFLNFLAKAGKAYPQFHLMMETEVVDLIQESGHIKGVKAKSRGAEREIQAELVVGADGRHSTVREKANLQVENVGAPIDVLWFKLSKRADDPKQLFALIDNGKLLVMVDRGDYWQCAFEIVKGEFEQIKTKGLQDFRQGITSLALFTKDRVNEITDWDQIKLLSVTVDRLQTWYRPGLICIGDAAHAMSPVGGVGINLAIQDAVAAANVLVPAFKKGTPTEANLARIQKRREFPTRMTQRFQVLVQDRVLIPYLQSNQTAKVPWMLRLFNWFPFLRSFPARFIGLGIRSEHVKY